MNVAPRRIAVITTSRADFGLYRPLLRRLRDDPAIALQLVAGGMHPDPRFGNTMREIEAEGFPIAAKVEHLIAGDGPAAIARSMAQGTAGYAEAFEKLAPEIVVVLGDRFEMHAAAVAALPFPLALAHIHGGELTLGALDDSFRHAMTKMAHLHFPAAETFAARLRQMGEEPWRITVTGALGLDNLTFVDPVAKGDLAARIGLPLDPPPLLATFHPETLDATPPEAQIEELLAALENIGTPVVFTAPNADAGGGAIRAAIEAFVARHPTARLVENLGTAAYFGLMRHAAAMVGNSSSGIIEAAAFALPVVNVGGRQEGRPRAGNVIDTPCARADIGAALTHALSAEFRAGLADLFNPYAAARPAAETIHARLRDVTLDEKMRRKVFIDHPARGA